MTGGAGWRSGLRRRPRRPQTGAEAKVGPPLLIVALGFVSVLDQPAADRASTASPGTSSATSPASLIPIVIIGLVRRIDLDRRRSPYYVPSSWLQPALVVLAVAAIVAAGLHVWPVATELAS